MASLLLGGKAVACRAAVEQTVQESWLDLVATVEADAAGRMRNVARKDAVELTRRMELNGSNHRRVIKETSIKIQKDRYLQ